MIRPGDRWHAAHFDDTDKSSPLVVACESCNERARVTGEAPSMVVVG